MVVIYEGKDITERINITAAICRDASRGRSDSIDLTLGRAKDWYAWKPQADDAIEILDGGYKSGTMFISAVAPEGDEYRILATAAKNGASRKAYAGYENKRLKEIMAMAAAECGMDYRIYGLSERYAYPYILRQDEGCAAFLQRLAAWEGAALKTYAGKFTMISIAAAQTLPAMETIAVTTEQPGVSYQRKEHGKVRSMICCTPYAICQATDSAAKPGNDRMLCGLPARDAATAARWARGMLLSHNREAEQLTIESELHRQWTAMGRIDITGGTDADGEWIIDEAIHDLVNKTSTAKMLRCIKTVK